MRRKKRRSAIQVTTAAGICAAVDLMRDGKLPRKGFVRQEDIPLPDFLANRFGQYYDTQGTSPGLKQIRRLQGEFGHGYDRAV